MSLTKPLPAPNPSRYPFARLVLLGLCSVALGLAGGCGDDAAGTGGSSSGNGAGGGGGADTCPDGAHPDAGSCVASLTGWTAGPSLMRARDHHVSFISETAAGAFLYVMGGTSGVGSPSRSVERALIGSDGALSAFEPGADLPEGLIGPGFAQLDRSFVLAGGLRSGGASSAGTWMGAVGDDGSVTLSAGPELNVSRYHVSLVETQGYVFAIGGMFQEIVNGAPNQVIEASVERASFDGTSAGAPTLGAFTMVDPLPAPSTHHAALAHGNALYVIGGGSGAAARTDILRATVGADGSLGPWLSAGTLPEARATSSAFVFLDQLYVIAGMKQLTGQERDTVLRAPIDAAGQVGSFEELTPLPLARAHSHQAPRFGANVFSIGGSIDHKNQADVFIGRFE